MKTIDERMMHQSIINQQST